MEDVSIFVMSALTVAYGFAGIPAAASVALSGSVLGSRLVSYYREVQIKTLDEAHPSFLIAKKELKA